jgi:hypothetical protein
MLNVVEKIALKRIQAVSICHYWKNETFKMASKVDAIL